MKIENGIPKTIFLQIGDEVDLSFTPFDELHKECVCWCEDRIFKNDIEYINKEYSDQQTTLLQEQFEDLKRQNLELQEQLAAKEKELSEVKAEMKRRFYLIQSETNQTVRETMISNLLID